ncbi:2-oxo acid dehydrogenase subunit E2 [Sporomusa sphaeroides]|uniref:2-oxo acid dehydrogenase subunit E2 n=1 Tax=Sporomusa sphaeroides TaxID=47679 RepID=UPI002D173916|nr:2-oxo acid dehydrogenase subunit E2 [Sporomusa sphaeroides]HML31858.1 2-oxo acid dehydrogenase subunit E2 [Sporomusa sphaeroides]
MESFDPGTVTEDGKEILQTLPITGARKAIKVNLTESLQTTAQASSFIKPDITKLVEYKDKLKAAGHKISYTALFAKLVSVILQKDPTLNCTSTDKKIIMYKSINIGIGTGGPKDLLYVPVIKNVENKGIAQIADELKILSQKVATGTFTKEDMSGCTFTLSSLGMYEVGAFTPILNLPAMAIMGVGNIFYEPACNENKEIIVRPTAYFSLTIDHALIQGVPVGRFWNEFIAILKDPEQYLPL